MCLNGARGLFLLKIDFMAEPKEYRLPKIGVSQKGRITLKKLRRDSSPQKAYRKYNSYDDNLWEHTVFYQNGGFVVTEKKRIAESITSSQAQIDYNKENSMAKKYASFGFQIEHLADAKRKGGNPDVRLKRRGPHIRVNGQLADLKRVESEKKVYERGRDAITKNGAKLIMFEFTFPREGKKWRKRLNDLVNKGWHGVYYFSGESEYHTF